MMAFSGVVQYQHLDPHSQLRLLRCACVSSSLTEGVVVLCWTPSLLPRYVGIGWTMQTSAASTPYQPERRQCPLRVRMPRPSSELSMRFMSVPMNTKPEPDEARSKTTTKQGQKQRRKFKTTYIPISQVTFPSLHPTSSTRFPIKKSDGRRARRSSCTPGRFV